MILSLPFSLPDATPIGDRYAMQTRDGITYYFFNLEPFDCHRADDRHALLLRAAKLHVVSGVPQADIMAALRISRPTRARAVRRYRERGEDAFFEPRRGRGRTVVDAEMAAKAAELLASGFSGSACARHLGISPTTFNENRRAGVIADPTRTPAAGADAPQAATAHRAGADAAQTDPAPDLTRPQAGAPALTLVFDREGWSPDLFQWLARRGIACITWHKNFKGDDWPAQEFCALEVPLHAPAGTSTTTVELAEQPIVLRNGLTVRQIRRRLANGRQVPVITTHPQMPLEQVAGAMFSRWSQENFFKYLREQFNLDALPSHGLEPLDPAAQVVNPVRRALEKTIRRVRSRLATARNRLAEALQAEHRDRATRLAADAQTLVAELDQLKQQRADTPTHVRAGELPEQDKLDALPLGGRLFMDVVRMIAYRAETRMMTPVLTAQGKKPNARRLLRALLTSDANIIPQPDEGILRIQLLGLGSDSCDRMLAPLIEELNATCTIYPGTELRLVYEFAGDPPPDVSSDSG